MPIVPSNAGKKRQQNQHSDAVEVARDRLTVALTPYFKGKTAKQRLDDAVAESIKAIAGLITTREVSGQNLGATVMTEAASMKNPATDEFNKPPRNL
jgi:hypothetical protein